MIGQNPAFRGRWQSLRWRLPLTMSLLLTAILAVVLWFAYREVESSLIAAAGDRARAASSQIAGLLEGAMRPAVAQLRQAAIHPALRDVLAEPTAANKAAAKASLTVLSRAAAPRQITLWDGAGQRVIDIVIEGREGSAAPLSVPANSPPTVDGLSPLQIIGNGVFIDSTATVPGLAPKFAALGFLTVRNALVISPPGMLGRLVGADAMVLIGNKSGDGWANLSGPIAIPAPMPSIDIAHDGVARYTTAAGDHIGALSGIRDTPWAIWVEFPGREVSAPARGFLGRMIALGVFVAVAGALLVLQLALQVTRPLTAMTAATEAVAAGDYSRRVSDDRQDELGRLGRAFDAMTARVANDVTARARAAEAMQEKEDRLRYTLAAARVGTWQMDLETTEMKWSDTMAPLFGIPATDLPTTREGALRLIHADDRAEVAECLMRANADERDHELYFRALQPDGAVKWAVGRSRLMPDASGRLRILGVCFDVTEQRMLEEQLRQSQKMDAIGKLAGGVAHDFNNLLTAILGFGSFLLDSMEPDDRRRDHVDEIMKAGRRAAELTAQLLAFSRKQLVQPVLVDVNTLVRDTTLMLGRLIGEHIKLETRLSVSSLVVSADPVQLQQVLMNLAINARDAMPEGGRLVIETGGVELDESYTSQHRIVVPGPYVMLAITDTGVGMSSEVRARMFEPFFTTKQRGQGTGLGLATVYGAVMQAGGHVWVYSEPGMGATFKVYLPRLPDGAEAIKPETVISSAAVGSETIMLVEDEAAVRLLAGLILSRAGYKVIEAIDAGDAETKHLNYPGEIRLLITDVVLPGSSGPELFNRISVRDPRLKVLYMSGYTDDAVFRTGRLQHGVAFIQKPFTAEGLRRKLREVLDE
jgi:PAS domain S-box-containing protein